MAKFDNVPYFMRTEMTKDRNYRRPKWMYISSDWPF